MRVIRFVDRVAKPRSFPIGVEMDTGVERVKFVLPQFSDSQVETLYWEMDELADADLLEDGVWSIDQTVTQAVGELACYITVSVSGEVLWHSDSFTARVVDLPQIEDRVAQLYPSAIQEAVEIGRQIVNGAEEAVANIEDAADEANASIAAEKEAALNAIQTAEESIPQDYSTLSSTVTELKSAFEIVDGAEMPSFRAGAMYAATGIEYATNDRSVTDFIATGDNRIIQFDFDLTGITEIYVFEFASNTTTASGTNEVLHRGVINSGIRYVLKNETHYIRIQVNTPVSSITRPIIMHMEEMGYAPIDNNTGKVICNWAFGSMYAETGYFYYSGYRVISERIRVKQGDNLRWLINGNYSVYLFKFKSGSFVERQIFQYNDNQCDSIVADSSFDCVYLNIISTSTIASIDDVSHNVEVKLISDTVFDIDKATSNEQIGLINVAWEQGGLYVDSGDEYYNKRIKTQMLRKPDSGIVYVSVPQGYFVRMYIFKEESGEPVYVDGYMGTQFYNYSTNFALRFRDEIKYFRMLAYKIENGEEAYLSPVVDGSKITVYTDTSIVNYSVDDDVSEYVVMESDNALDKINGLTVGENTFSFIAVGDMHYWYNNPVVKRSIRDMGNAVELICDQFTPDYLISFGDQIYRYRDQYLFSEGKAEMIACEKLLNNCFNGLNIPQIRLVGNHDPNSLQLNNGALEKYFTMNDLYKYIGKYSTTLTTDPLNTTGSYGYVDISAKKLRVICLNTSDFTDEGHPPISAVENLPNVNGVNTYMMSVGQIAWFADTLKLDGISDPQNWNILILSHIPISSTYTTLFDNLGCNIWKIVDDYKNKRSSSITVKGTTISYDYSGVTTACILPQIHGHNHTYEVKITNIANEYHEVANGETVKICIPNVLPYRTSESYKQKISMTKDSTAFCAVKIDLTNSVIYAIHYGAAVDRIVHYSSVSVSSSETLTSVYSNVAWGSDDTSIATVSNGVVTKVSAGNALVSATDQDGNKEFWVIKCI